MPHPKFKVRCTFKTDHHLGMYPSADQPAFRDGNAQGEIQLDNLKSEVTDQFVGGAEYIVTFERVPTT